MKKISVVLILLSLVTACSLFREANMNLASAPDLRAAELALRQKDHSAAIEAYKRHIKARLSAKERPDWENPYFYMILIGDIKLKEGDIEGALAAYEEAEEHDVDPGFISDRYRYVASWQEQEGNLADAIDTLTKYRDRDPLLFDLMADRIARKLVNEESSLSLATDEP